MSNYFDGLIRASGLAAGSYPPVAADHGITEIEVQHDAPPSATSPVTEEPRTNDQRADFITPPPMATPTLPAPPIREDAAPPRKAYTGLASDRSLPASPAQSPQPQSDLPDLGQAMAHALRWVTADVESPSALTEIALEPAPPNLPQALTTHGITPLRVAPIRQPESIDQTSPWASGTRRPATHDETVEISIGAIHLRVDAPPPQTVVQAPAPTPRPPADRPPRSALSRRALRRI